MADDFKIDFSQYEAVVEEVQRIIEQGDFADVARPALNATGEHILELTTDKFYPESESPPWVDVGMPFSAQQRRWWFWALKNGKVDASYRRTGELGRGLEFKVIMDGDEFIIQVGVNWEDASYVIGSEEDQSPFHKGRWIPLETILEDNEEDIAEFYVTSLAAAIQGHLDSI